MADNLTINYYASRDLLGVVSDEEYGQFKDLLLEALQAEWPDAQISIEDDEDAVLEVGGVSGEAAQDVRDRIEDIVNDLVENGAWQEEDDDFLAEEDEIEEDENEEY
jgi:broad specificity phosphatase PhoE